MSLFELGNEAWSAAVYAAAAGLLLAAIPIVRKEFTYLKPILFGLGIGAVVFFLWISKLLPLATGTPGNSEDSRLFLGLVALIISIFTGVALKLTFDQAQDAKRIRDEMREQMEKFQIQMKRAERLAWITNEIALESVTAILSSDRQTGKYIGLPYLANLYKNPQNIGRSCDLSLDVFIARSEIRKIMNYDDRVYVHWLTEHFDSPIEFLKQEVRKQAVELHALLQSDQSQI